MIFFANAFSASAPGVRLKNLARVQGDKDLSLIGYGIVVGLSGTGDSSRNKMTIQSLKNTLTHFGLVLDDKDIVSRNVAAVMVTAKVSSFSERGDQVDIVVSSMGDARSLTGGTLVLTPLYGVDEKIYGFAQGQISVGGYEFEKEDNLYRKNHTTVGRIVKGGMLERSAAVNGEANKEVVIILNEPDYTTATKIANAIRNELSGVTVTANHPGKLTISAPNNGNQIELISKMENIIVYPDLLSRIVINERTGTIVAGGNIVLGAVSIAHGDLKIEIDTTYTASQPTNGFFSGGGVKSMLVPNVDVGVEEEVGRPIAMPSGTTVSDFVVAMNKINLSTRDIITILQSMKTAGALHAELIVE